LRGRDGAVLVAQVGVLLLLAGVHGLDLVHGLAGGDDDRVEFIEQRDAAFCTRVSMGSKASGFMFPNRRARPPKLAVWYWTSRTRWPSWPTPITKWVSFPGVPLTRPAVKAGKKRLPASH
jgi:hypothetical protein